MVRIKLNSVKCLLLIVIICTVLLIFLALYLSDTKNVSEASNKKQINQREYNHNTPIVLWWTELLPNYYQTQTCGPYKCIFTVDRSYLNDKNTKALVFYGSDFNKTDLPLPRRSNHLWALYHEESPKNLPLIQFEKVIENFNITATFSRHSSFPLTLQYLQSLTLLRSRKYMRPIGDKARLRETEKLAPIAFVQSICDTISGRDDYVKELMKYIKVDSYGKCLNNKKLPDSLTKDYLQTIESDEFYHFFSRYKFIISYENGVCNDYITEKLWRPLVLGVIPIYFGSPTIRDWLPNDKSAIIINDFDSPKELAKYLQYLDENNFEYNTYLDHKYSQNEPISNKLLEKTLLTRQFESEMILNGFECFICKKMYDQKFQSIANRKHYECPSKLEFPPGIKQNIQLYNDWKSIMDNGKCEAKVLDHFLSLNNNYTTKEFSKLFMENIRNGVCKLGIDENDYIHNHNESL